MSDEQEKSVMDEVVAFLMKHENRRGPVGEFIRYCISVAEVSEVMTRSELRDSAQMGYLLDCFLTADDLTEETNSTAGSRPRKDPTPEEIAAEAAKIQAEWPEHRWAKELPKQPPVEALVVKLDKRHNGVLM